MHARAVIYIHARQHARPKSCLQLYIYSYIRLLIRPHLSTHTHKYVLTLAHIHTYIRTSIHTFLPTRPTPPYTHTHIYIYTYTRTHTYIYTYLPTYLPTTTPPHTYIHTHTYTLAYINIYKHTHIYTTTYIRCHTHLYVHTDTQTYLYLVYSHTFNIQLYTDYTYWFARSHACTIISLIKNLYHHIFFFFFFLIWFLRDIQASNDGLAWCPNPRDRQRASDRQQLCACTLNVCVQPKIPTSSEAII